MLLNCQPLCVIFKNKHYLSLRGPEKGSNQVPKESLQETPGHFRATLSGAGLRSIATPSVKSGSSFSRLSQAKELPTPTVHSDIATPSVKTVLSRTQSGRVPSVRSKFGKKEKAGGASKLGGCSQVTFSAPSYSVVDEGQRRLALAPGTEFLLVSFGGPVISAILRFLPVRELEITLTPEETISSKNMDSKPLTSAFLKTTEWKSCSLKFGTNLLS